MPLIAIKILKNPWTWVVVAVVAALLMWKYRGPLISVFRPSPLPTHGGAGVPLTGQEATMVRSITQRLWTDIDRWNNPWFASRDTETWKQYLELTDPLFIAVYNDFGSLYYGRAAKTLKDYLREENFSLTSSVFMPWGVWSGTQLKDALLERMDNLNLQ